MVVPDYPIQSPGAKDMSCLSCAYSSSMSVPEFSYIKIPGAKDISGLSCAYSSYMKQCLNILYEKP